MIDILNIKLGILNVCDHILLELLRLSFIDIAQVHIVSTLELFLTAVSICHSTLNIFHVKFIVIEELLSLSFLRNLRLQQV